MKKLCFLLFTSCLLFASCSKKTQPSRSSRENTVSRNRDTPKSNDGTVIDPELTTSPTNITPPAVKNFSAPMVVIDAGGKIITSRENLPEDISERVKYSEIARAYTPVQKNNLIVRFKIVPPRVLFVPKELAKTSAKGSYIIYKKKFWYWKKEDGLFHLDDTYYQ